MRAGQQLCYLPETCGQRQHWYSDNCDCRCVSGVLFNRADQPIDLISSIPTCAAIVVLFFLHRRIRRRQRAEDANDPHASLDFGMGNVKTSKKGKPEMTSTDMGGSLRPGFRGRGLSMDLGSSYLLPAAIQGSHDSLHSMSRVMTDHDDPYRPVTFVKSDTDSSRPTSRMRPDNASVHTGFSERSGEKSRLIQTTTHESRPHALPQPPSASSLGSTLSNPPRGASLATGAKSPGRWYPRDDKKYGSESPPDLSAAPATPQDLLSDRSMPSFPQAVQIPRGQYMEDRNGQRQSLLDMSDARNPAHDALHITVPSPAHNRQSPPRSPAAHQPYMNDFEVPANEEPQPRSERLATHADLDTESRRVSVMGLRPLPPDDVIDNPEQRANRIRSFYKEYFDDSKPNPAGQYPQYDPYGEEYYADYLEDGAVYDPETGAFFTQQRPYAEPVGRRAMTPPPRGAAPMVPSHRSVVSTQSAGRPLPPPKKRLPPPKALQSLPTPHMLRDDTSMHSPIDFAPPTSFRDRQLGRGPDSPTGTARPYSPAFRAHVPLAQSFDDLAAMPSP